MILSDRDIKARLEKGDLVVDPITDWDLQLQPASLDVRLGTEFAMYQLPHLPCIDPRDKENIDAVTMPVELPEGEPFVLHPGSSRSRILPSISKFLQILSRASKGVAA